jgi:hypothetical protein
MAHTCHATNCERTTKPELFMCYPHWMMVPRPMQQRIWATYRPGQCDDLNPSAEYCQAARGAVIAVAEKEGIEPDTVLYDMFETRARELQADDRL